jgi:cell division protein ZapA
MDGSSKPVRVTIFNQNYSLLASGEPGAVEELALSVDDIMHRISDETGTIDGTRTAVLACLHLADQVRTLQRDLERMKGAFETKARQFTIRIDEALEDA